jgi:anaerobic selenocysteine-containing dehydrogenase
MLKVTVDDGVITRMRPLRLTEEDGGHWTIEAKGKKFSDPRKTTINTFNIAERTRVYSENRIKYPMKRKNFDPNGERHPELRGKDEYERITWDEALDLVTSEIKRVQGTYGKAAITAYVSSHHNYGLLYYKMGPMPRFYNILGYTQLLDNPDSWEGWHWGSMHTWGWYWRFGQCDCFDMLAEAMKNTEQVVYWSVDPNTSASWE